MRSPLKAWWRRVRPGVLAPLLAGIVGGIGRTLRLQSPGFEAFADLDAPVIFSGWHGRSFIAPHLFRGRGYYVMVSLSRDGEMQANIFTRFGFKIIRGSTGREGVKALVDAIRVLRKENAKMALTPDGPRGPSGVVQEGIIAMGQKSGALLVPVGVAAKNCCFAKSWDRYMVPMPFSRAIMLFGDPVRVPKDADKETLERSRLELQAAMHRIQAEAERRMA